jgi:hypothetical protein
MTTKRVGSSLSPFSSAANGRQAASEWAVRELPARAATFLRAVSVHAPIRAALASGGYGPAEHQEGLTLLVMTCSYGQGGTNPQEDDPQRRAEAALLQWGRTHFGRLHAALMRLHPEYAGLFSLGDAERSASAVLSIAALLDALDALAAGAPVLATLSSRGRDATVHNRLRGWVNAACEAPTPAPPASDTPDSALQQLHDWYTDWSATARTFIRRKDWLIRLGLGARRRKAALPE